MPRSVRVPSPSDGSSGLDVALLGVVAIAMSLYVAALAPLGDQAPHLIRFFDYESPADLPPLAVTPQDSALILLLDDSTRSSQPAAGPPAIDLAAGIPEAASVALLIVGLVLLLCGPLWIWLGRPRSRTAALDRLRGLR